MSNKSDFNIDVSPAISSVDEEIDRWLMGVDDDIPQNLRLAMKNLFDKLNFSMGSLAVAQLKRSLKLMKTIEELEAEMTSPEYLLSLEPEARAEVLNYCNQTLQNNLKYLSDFMKNNDDLKNPLDSKAQTLQDMLLSLDGDTIDNLITLIEEQYGR